MKESVSKNIRKWFEDYTKQFHSEDEEIEEIIGIKLAHSYRVSENCMEISSELALSKTDIRTAEIIGILHDVGRFEQSVKYRTMKDVNSKDHALLGKEIVEKENILSELSNYEKKIILTAIIFHNLRALPEVEDKNIRFFSSLIRDADKLDILGVLANYYEKKSVKRNPILQLELEDKPGYSNSSIKCILNNRVSDAKDMKTLNDFKLLQLSWVFDINFLLTMKFIRRKRYFERILAKLPDSRDIQQVSTHIRKTMESFLEK